MVVEPEGELPRRRYGMPLWQKVVLALMLLGTVWMWLQ